jgi:hypothetical protein
MTVLTSNKGWTIPSPGGSAGTWGTELNSAFAQIDNDLGKAISVSTTGGSTVLSAAQTETLFIAVSGTLTSNATITLTPETGGPTYAQGFWLIQNSTTGNYTVTFTNGVGSSLAVVPQGRFCLILGHSTLGTRIISADDGNVPSGTIFVCGNSSAPTGWTRLTSSVANDAALRLVTGTGGGTGGAVAFSSLFNVNITNLAVHGHGVTDPGHVHSKSAPTDVLNHGYGGGVPYHVWFGSTTNNTDSATTGITINNSGSGSTTAFDVKYYDVFLAQKN